MVQIRSREPVTVYEMIDDGGRAIGEVRQPAGEPVIGRGEGTVLLRRDDHAPAGRHVKRLKTVRGSKGVAGFPPST